MGSAYGSPTCRPSRARAREPTLGPSARRGQRARLEDESKVGDLRTRHESLTARERQIMAVLVAGRVNKQIAAEIGISEVTVRLHRGQIMRKMHASSLADFIRISDKIKS